MRRLTSIVALNQTGVIGCKNALPWRLKTDMAFFKAQTMGNVVIMGRKTFDSLGRRPLPGRYNVVVSHDFGLMPAFETFAAATGIAEALSAAENAPRKFKEIFVVGGQTMYEQFSDIVDRYLLTVVDKVVEDGDTVFDEKLVAGAEWISTPIQAVLASTSDEADFTITELARPRTDARRLRRSAMIKTPNQRAGLGQPRRDMIKLQPAMSALF
jgi:dihydrofolate reductase